jgi:hypothetical protein
MKLVGPPYWNDKPVILIGGGASLRGLDLKRFEKIDAYIVGIKYSMFHLRCHAGVAADRQFCVNQRAKLLEQKLRGTELFLMPNDGVEKDFAPLEQTKRDADTIGLSDDPGLIYTRGNSGYAALNVAYLKKHVRPADPTIFLFGYDHDSMGAHYHDSSLQENGPRAYWHTRAQDYFAAVPRIKLAGLRVINANLRSEVEAFSRCELEDAMTWLERHYAIST